MFYFQNKYFQFKYFQFYVHYIICCYCHLGRITVVPDDSKLHWLWLYLLYPLLGWLCRLPGWFYSIAFMYSYTCITFNLYYYCITVLLLPTLCPFPLYGIRATLFWPVIVVLCSLSLCLCLLETLVLRCIKGEGTQHWKRKHSYTVII